MFLDEIYRERGDKSLMEEFFNSLEEIAQRIESRRSEKQSKCRPEQWSDDRPVGVHNVHRRSSVDCPVDRSNENY